MMVVKLPHWSNNFDKEAVAARIQVDWQLPLFAVMAQW